MSPVLGLGHPSLNDPGTHMSPHAHTVPPLLPVALLSAPKEANCPLHSLQPPPRARGCRFREEAQQPYTPIRFWNSLFSHSSYKTSKNLKARFSERDKSGLCVHA